MDRTMRVFVRPDMVLAAHMGLNEGALCSHSFVFYLHPLNWLFCVSSSVKSQFDITTASGSIVRTRFAAL